MFLQGTKQHKIVFLFASDNFMIVCKEVYISILFLDFYEKPSASMSAKDMTKRISTLRSLRK